MNDCRIYINGTEYPADSQKTLLDNILENGVALAHLCHNPQIESYGGCGLCVVEVEGIRKPLRACSTAVSDGMRVTTSTPALEESRRVALALLLSDHTGDCKAPCFHACPTHQDVQGYVGLIANGHEKEALRLIKKDNPLPASIGRVCPHPCEKECRRKYFEGAVSICALKRFAAESEPDYIPDCAEKNGKKVAVIGAGPAGLSCAYFLLLRGYSVDIFEAQREAGGMLRYGIPAYRLPREVLAGEVALTEKMGAVFHYGKALGKDFTVSSLKNDFDAVFVAVGAWGASKLHCPGDDTEGVLGGIDFLYSVSNGEKPEIGDNVAVVGGGNTAIDAVRTAVRIGAKKVTLLYRRTESEMPAESEEICDAKDEGVIFRFLTAPDSVITENGKAVGLRLQAMELGEPDASGRRSPVPVEGAITDEYYSTVISAIGQRVNADFGNELELTKKGTVSVDENSFMTSLDGVFAAGDAVNNGPDIAIRAIAGGKNAAASIDAWINGKALSPVLPDYVKNDSFDPSSVCKPEHNDRREVRLVNPEIRKSGFCEVSETFSKEDAVAEAQRCLQCGCSAVYDCKLLPLLREYDSFKMPLPGIKTEHKKDNSHPFIIRDNNKCVLCALCVRACREISGTENLGLFGRGFPTEPMSAFDLPLSESKCVSCGACVSVCPTGALTSKTLTRKNLVLPFEEKSEKCTLCKKECGFVRRTINGRTVKMIPEDLRKSCSLGVFGPVLSDGEFEGVADEKKTEILKIITASVKYAEIPAETYCTFDKILRLFQKN